MSRSGEQVPSSVTVGPWTVKSLPPLVVMESVVSGIWALRSGRRRSVDGRQGSVFGGQENVKGLVIYVNDGALFCVWVAVDHPKVVPTARLCLPRERHTNSGLPPAGASCVVLLMNQDCRRAPMLSRTCLDIFATIV